MSANSKVGSNSSCSKHSKSKRDVYSKLKYLKELSNVKSQVSLNNELNQKTLILLNNLKCPTSIAKHQENKKATLKENTQNNFKKRLEILSLNKNISKINNDLISYVRLRQNYMQHDNYWKQSWLFTDNPIYEFENHQGFDNPAYAYLLNLDENNNTSHLSKRTQRNFTQYHSSYLDNLINTFEAANSNNNNYQATDYDYSTSSSSSVMNIYEDILDLNQKADENTNLFSSSSSILSSSLNLNNQTLDSHTIKTNEHFKTRELEISSPESNDSGIHSDDRLNRHSNSTSIMDSLYSSVISTKKSESEINSKTSNDCTEQEMNSDNYDEIDPEAEIIHVEQHALPLGWIRCCDETGIYYWHKPSGTVTRKPPQTKLSQTSPSSSNSIDVLTPHEKNFSVTEFVNSDLYKKYTETSSSETSSNASAKETNCLSNENMHQIDHPLKLSTKRKKERINSNNNVYLSDCSSSSASSSMSSSSCSTNIFENKIKNINKSPELSSQNSASLIKLRFYVRSLGWVKIDENDLTPERSSKAVNKCINDLSRGIKDLNDVVARWGQGKDLYMDLHDNYLILSDPIDDKILNKQSITSIRVWGVGRDNGRDFAYVARDKQTKIHMCHVFRCDSSPAKEIANALRDTCKRIINEKKLLENQSNDQPRNMILKRPSFLPELAVNNNLNLNKRKSYNTTSINSVDERPQTDITPCFPKPMDEPKKVIQCRYLGNTQVNKPSGIDVLNAGIEKIYSNAYDEYKRMKREQIKKLKNKNDDFNDKKNSLFDTDEDELDDYDFDLDQDSTISFDNLLDLNTEKNLGVKCEIVISPSTISVNENSEHAIFECRTRYLSFMGISNDVRLCGFIMHCIDNTFRCHAFLCENSSGPLCKTIEAACKLRYQKCLDAHPENLADPAISESTKQNQQKLGYLGSQLKNMLDSIKYRNLFTNISLTTKSNK